MTYLKGICVVGMLGPGNFSHNLVRLYLVHNLALACLYILKYIRNTSPKYVRKE